MSTQQAIIDSYQELVRFEEAPPLKVGALHADSRQMNENEHENLLQALNDFLPASGWVSFQSEVCMLKGETEIRSTQETGWVLQAELCKENRSLHVRQNGKGGWIISTISENSSSDKGILEEVKYLTMPEQEDGKEHYLVYQVYWEAQKKPQGGYAKTLSRLQKLEPFENPAQESTEESNKAEGGE